MNRFEYVSTVDAEYELPSLLALAASFYAACAESVVEGLDPATDPAVIILGSYIAFAVNADANTAGNFRKLVTQCQERASENPTRQ